MSTSRYAVVRRLSRVLLLPLHGHVSSEHQRNMRRLPVKDPASQNDQKLCTKDNCLSCCKKFTAFMFSRVGLFFVMIGYVAVGGWLFQALEAGNEENMRRSMIRELNTTLYKLWDEILRINAYPLPEKKGNFTLFASNELEKFEVTVIEQVQRGFDGRIRPDADTDWNYFGAILYAVTLVSTIGYGHITTKTIPGKIATILYSAFGVPLMMLFVANIGSTMAKMFAFVFSRITMIFCCRWSGKRKRKKIKSRPINPMIIDEKYTENTMKSNLKRHNDESELKKMVANDIRDRSAKLRFQADLPSSSSPITTHVSLVSSANELETATTNKSVMQSLPADIRLNMLTGLNNPSLMPQHPSRSLASSTSTVHERPKDALTRINDLIRQNSVQDVQKRLALEEDFDDKDIFLTPVEHPTQQRRRSIDMNPMQFYIDETKKLTENLENPTEITIGTTAPTNVTLKITNLDDEAENQQEIGKNVQLSASPSSIIFSDARSSRTSSKKSRKKELKRSKSETSYNRKSQGKNNPTVESLPSVVPTKSIRRRFFSRKPKKNATSDDTLPKSHSLDQPSSESNEVSTRKLAQKSQSFNDRVRPLSPPPNYEESTNAEVTPLPITTTSLTWKTDEPTSKTVEVLDMIPTELEEEMEFYEEDEPMSVPLLVTVFVIPLYLTLGAILFNIWEKWGFLNSFYFCFITLTTIGFGDFVPGSSLTVSAAKEKLISAALYILLGLVLIAMCFNLMKEQLTQKFKQVAGKWGMSEF